MVVSPKLAVLRDHLSMIRDLNIWTTVCTAMAIFLIGIIYDLIIRPSLNVSFGIDIEAANGLNINIWLLTTPHGG